jgi:predicted transcriptional regulator
MGTDVLSGSVDENEQQLAAIDSGLAQADAGELVEYDEVVADVQARLAAVTAKR